MREKEHQYHSILLKYVMCERRPGEQSLCSAPRFSMLWCNRGSRGPGHVNLAWTSCGKLSYALYQLMPPQTCLATAHSSFLRFHQREDRWTYWSPHVRRYNRKPVISCTVKWNSNVRRYNQKSVISCNVKWNSDVRRYNQKFVISCTVKFWCPVALWYMMYNSWLFCIRVSAQWSHST